MRLPVHKFRLPWLALDSWLHRFVDASPEAVSPPRIGLVLSSGGARGLAHVGAIQVLEEAGIPIAAVIGSSMGAYVGALWAAGVNGRGLAELAAEIKDRRTLLRLIDPAIPPTKGFLRGRRSASIWSGRLATSELSSCSGRHLSSPRISTPCPPKCSRPTRQWPPRCMQAAPFPASARRSRCTAGVMSTAGLHSRCR